MALSTLCASRAPLPPTNTLKSFTSLSFNSNLLFSSLSSTSSSPFSLKTLATTNPSIKAKPISCSASPSTTANTTATKSFYGPCYVLSDNIDTDQIIPAEYLTLVPSKRDEYEKLGSYALCGLPASHSTRFVEPGENKTKFSIIIAGSNFGCGSSREHAPVALGAAGVKVVVAESYARIFFRNSVSTGEIYPLESEGRICDEFSTGDLVAVEMGVEEIKLINHSTGKEYVMKPIGDAGPVVDAGGIFAYARKAGMLAA